MYSNEFFDQHPVFRYQMFKDFMAIQGTKREASVRQLLNYSHKNKKIIRIRRLLYATAPSPMQSEWIDPYLIAAHAIEDAVLGYHTALEMHHLAYTTFNELVYLTKSPSHPFSFQNKTYRPICYSQKLLTKKQTRFEVVPIQRQGMTIYVTSLERTIVDVLDRPDLSGGFEEVIRSLDHLVNFDIDKIISYALLLDKASIAAKVGYFLERLPTYLAVGESALQPLLAAIPKQPYYLDPSQKGKGQGTYIAKWQLIVPNYLMRNGWEEKNEYPE